MPAPCWPPASGPEPELCGTGSSRGPLGGSQKWWALSAGPQAAENARHTSSFSTGESAGDPGAPDLMRLPLVVGHADPGLQAPGLLRNGVDVAAMWLLQGSWPQGTWPWPAKGGDRGRGLC